MNKRLENIKSTIERCENWGEIKETRLTCPLCKSKLFTARTGYGMCHVMDGNQVFYCENEDHNFWQNARSRKNILFLYRDASDTSFDYEKAFEFTDEEWIEIKDEDNIV
jgi:hypothetical protein